MSKIHETAIIDPTAEIHSSVEVGPYTVIGKDVKIGKDSVIASQVCICDRVTIGEGNKIYQFASIGNDPQDLSYGGEETSTIIGDNNKIREFVTIHKGTDKSDGTTVCGSNNLFMAYVHIAHDCRVGSNIVLANGVTLGGHVEVDDHAIIGGIVPVHQFCKVGEYSMTGGGSVITMDIPPYVMAVGNRAHFYGLNLIGLRRHKFSREAIKEIKTSYDTLFRSKGTVKENMEVLKNDLPDSEYAKKFIEFIEASTRGLAKAKAKSESDGD